MRKLCNTSTTLQAYFYKHTEGQHTKITEISHTKYIKHTRQTGLTRHTDYALRNTKQVALILYLQHTTHPHHPLYSSQNGYTSFKPHTHAAHTGKEQSHCSGFTLLEAVLSLTLLAIMGTMLAMFGSQMMQESVVPAVQTQQMYDLRQVMENITLDYEGLIMEYDNPLCELAKRVHALDSDPATGYGAYKGTVQFVKVTGTTNQKSIVPTGVDINNCLSHSPHDDVAVLQVILTPAKGESDVSVTGLFTTPE